MVFAVSFWAVGGKFFTLYFLYSCYFTSFSPFAKQMMTFEYSLCQSKPIQKESD